MSIYSDKVLYRELDVEIAYRAGSVEINYLRADVKGYRVCIDGCWAIVSVQGFEDREAVDRAMRIAREAASRGGCGGLAEAELFRGNVELGKDIDVDELTREIVELCSEAKALNVVKCEMIATVKRIEKSIEREGGEVARELRRVVDIEIGLTGFSPYGRKGFASSFRALIPWDTKSVLKSLEETFRETMEKLRKSCLAKPLSIYMIGRATVVLDPIATAALIHELSHLLDPSYEYSVKQLGISIGPPEMELVDDPHIVDAPSMRFFDDEGVVAKKRVLIEEGRIVDLHHTRNTAKIYGSEPGSAYGLFHRPIPFHSVLAMKSGDWREQEILEDTQRGFYIEGIAMATLESGYVRIVPENAYIVEKGELKEAVRVRNVKIPIAKLKTINAISRNRRIRTSYEKNWLVAEIAPMIRLEAYIE